MNLFDLILSRFSAFAKLLCVSAALSLLALNAQTVNLSLGSASGKPAASVSVPLSVTTNNAQPTSLMWTLAYAPADISKVSATVGSAATAAAKTINCDTTASGRYTCVVSGLNRTVLGNGDIANVTFTLASTIAGSATSIQLLDTSGSSATGDGVASTGMGSTLTVVRSLSLSDIVCSPSALVAPASSQCTVSLTGAAPSAGVSVSLGYSASGANVTMPTNVTVPAGSSSAKFNVQINSANSPIQISATALGLTKNTSISVSSESGATVAVAVSPDSSTITAGQTQQFTAAVTGSTNTAVTWSLSPAIGTVSASGLYKAPASVSSQQTVTIRATSVANTAKYATASVVIGPTTVSGATYYSVFPTTVTPGILEDSDKKGVELGMKFYSNVDGYVTGVRFYKGSSKNGGTHVGTLWTSSGQRLATATFKGETSTGWQQVNFATPVKVEANTTYVVSYFAPNGRYSATARYFGAAIDKSPLYVPAGSAGVYRYGSTSALPTQSFNNSNYWVDVVFKR